MTRARLFRQAMRIFFVRLGKDDRGVSAVEFAIVVPVLLLIYLGGYEASDATATYRKLADTTVELANVTAQYTTMSASDVSNVMNASAEIMAPYATSNLSIVLSEISTNATGLATVQWSQPYNGATPLQQGAVVILPSGMATPTTSYILVTTSYAYALPTGWAFKKPFVLTSQIYMLPRQSASIPYTG